MRAHGERLVYPCATAGTILGRIRWVHRFHSLTGACCLVGEDREEVAPPGVLNRLVEAGFAAGPGVLVGAYPAVLVLLGRGATAQIGRLNRLHIDHVVVAHERKRRLVMEVLALPAHMLMLLRLLQRMFGLAVVSGVLHDVPIRRDEEHLEAHVEAGLPSRLRERLGGHL